MRWELPNFAPTKKEGSSGQNEGNLEETLSGFIHMEVSVLVSLLFVFFFFRELELERFVRNFEFFTNKKERNSLRQKVGNLKEISGIQSDKELVLLCFL